MAIISLYRVSGRTRRWFYEKDPSSLLYLAFEPTDNKPSLLFPKLKSSGKSWEVRSLLWRGGEPILLTINSILIGVLCSLATMWGLLFLSIPFQVRGPIGMMMVLVGALFFWRRQKKIVLNILAERDQGLTQKEFHGITPTDYEALVWEAKRKRQHENNSPLSEDEE